MKTAPAARHRQSGFTLVEVAIVLVIIGLLLRGILKGQELITQARIKNVINDFNGVTAAMNAYRDRYRAIPGDDNGATGRWRGVASIVAPGVGVAGDGVIAGVYNDNNAAAETRLFWAHLRQAGFVSGSGADLPPNALSGIMGVQTGNGAGGAALTNGDPGLGGIIMCSTNITDKVAGPVDTQIDDGIPQTGQMRGLPVGGTPAVTGAVPAAPARYQETGGIYTLCNNV